FERVFLAYERIGGEPLVQNVELRLYLVEAVGHFGEQVFLKGCLKFMPGLNDLLTVGPEFMFFEPRFPRGAPEAMLSMASILRKRTWALNVLTDVLAKFAWRTRTVVAREPRIFVRGLPCLIAALREKSSFLASLLKHLHAQCCPSLADRKCIRLSEGDQFRDAIGSLFPLDRFSGHR